MYDNMKNLSAFIKDTYNKGAIDKMFECSTFVSTIKDAELVAKRVCMECVNSVVFENTICKNCFISVLSKMKPNIKVINCNCSIDSFFENDFDGFLVFNNLKFCKHKEIIEEIKKHKGVMIS